MSKFVLTPKNPGRAEIARKATCALNTLVGYGTIRGVHIDRAFPALMLAALQGESTDDMIRQVFQDADIDSMQRHGPRMP